MSVAMVFGDITSCLHLKTQVGPATGLKLYKIIILHMDIQTSTPRHITNQHDGGIIQSRMEVAFALTSFKLRQL